MHLGRRELALAILTAACSLVGCDGGGGDTDPTGDDAESGWSIQYSGAMTGEIAGSVVQAGTTTLSQNTVTVAGDSLDDVDFNGTYTYPVDGDPLGEKSMLTFGMNLADGSFCTSEPPDHVVTVTVLDGSDDTYSAEFAGSVSCDGAVLDIDGYARR